MNALVEALEEGDGSVDLRGLEAESKGELARLPCAETDGGVDGLLEDGLGSFGGDFLDLHAAGLRGHEDQPAGGAVEHDAEVELAVDGSGLFNRAAAAPSGLAARSGASPVACRGCS